MRRYQHRHKSAALGEAQSYWYVKHCRSDLHCQAGERSSVCMSCKPPRDNTRPKARARATTPSRLDAPGHAAVATGPASTKSSCPVCSTPRVAAAAYTRKPNQGPAPSPDWASVGRLLLSIGDRIFAHCALRAGGLKRVARLSVHYETSSLTAPWTAGQMRSGKKAS